MNPDVSNRGGTKEADGLCGTWGTGLKSSQRIKDHSNMSDLDGWTLKRRKVRIKEMRKCPAPGGRRVVTNKSLSVLSCIPHRPCTDTLGFQPAGFLSSSFLLVLILVTLTAHRLTWFGFLSMWLTSRFLAPYHPEAQSWFWTLLRTSSYLCTSSWCRDFLCMVSCHILSPQNIFDT